MKKRKVFVSIKARKMDENSFLNKKAKWMPNQLWKVSVGAEFDAKIVHCWMFCQALTLHAMFEKSNAFDITIIWNVLNS